MLLKFDGINLVLMKQLVLVVPRISYLLLLKLHLGLHCSHIILSLFKLLFQGFYLIPALSRLICRIYQFLSYLSVLSAHLTLLFLCFMPHPIESLFKLRLQPLDLFLPKLVGTRLALLHEPF